jgi:tripartite-type tricarboxylate transporter receptor subunit TctC
VFYAGDISSQIKSGAVRAIAHTGLSRNEDRPDLPGLPAYAGTSTHYVPWSGLFAKSGTPQIAIEKISLAVQAALGDEDVKSKIQHLGSRPMLLGAKELNEYWIAYVEMWATIARNATLKAE